MDVWLSCLSWKPQVLECKEKEEISKRLMANHCNGSNSQTKWTLAWKHKFLLQKENSHASKGTCRFVIAMFLFFVSLAQALYCGLRGGDVSVQVLKVEMWMTVFPLLLCVHDQQVCRMHTVPIRLRNQETQDRPVTLAAALLCWTSTVKGWQMVDRTTFPFACHIVSLALQFYRDVTDSWWLVDDVAHSDEGLRWIWGDSQSLSSHFHRVCKLRYWVEKQNLRSSAVVTGPSPVTPAVLNNQSGVHFKPWWCQLWNRMVILFDKLP